MFLNLMYTELTEAQKKLYKQMTPLGRFGMPEVCIIK
jgi:hypothetical protein